MTYKLECRHLYPDCESEVRGESEEEVMEGAARHVDEHHGVRQLEDETVQKLRAEIRPA